MRVNSAGKINYKTGQYSISQALVGQAVQINVLNDKLVVRFRHRYVREIDQNTGNGKSVLQEP